MQGSNLKTVCRLEPLLQIAELPKSGGIAPVNFFSDDKIMVGESYMFQTK